MYDYKVHANTMYLPPAIERRHNREPTGTIRTRERRVRHAGMNNSRLAMRAQQSPICHASTTNTGLDMPA